ncbi:SxtJ family membrane protein [Dyadobacter sandarakinus]|uniref:SxtJ n=1 Tax=Dyadobacter sandarakinus TaxID=2747268 RepID=A0ABX7IC44_9BACT|nr:SxtJ family membrane protein [Dyadobacter sandarakinus]QRR03684.1 hypothetical protein HWI92_23585 [Dyadobacter sandarakinus]
MEHTEEAKSQLVIVTGLLVIYFVLKSRYPFLLWTAAGIGLVSVFIPAAGSLIVKVWLKLAVILGRINGSILLTAIFFAVLLPIALLSRMLGKDPLYLKHGESSTTFRGRNHRYSARDLEKTW